MELQFVKVSPNENMTLLIESPVPRNQHLAVAKALIAYGSVYAEQAGYIEEPENKAACARLQMMAGEFCGNATASLAAYLCATTDRTDFNLEVSGAGSPVKCHVENRNGEYIVTVDMPLPLNVDEIMLPELSSENLTIVSFPGITHIIMENKPSE